MPEPTPPLAADAIDPPAGTDGPGAPGAPIGLAQLALVQETMGIVTWIWDTETGRVDWYGDLSPLLGRPRGGYSGRFTDFEAMLHPDDRPASRPRLVACLKGDLDQYRAEERVLHPDGSVHWLETHGRATRGADGRTLRIAGVVRDITERRAMAQVLEASEQRFRHLIEDAPVAIGISRGEHLLYGNPSFARLFGFADAESVVGSLVLDRVAGASRADFLRRSGLRAAGAKVETSFDMALLRTDGSELACLVSITEVELADGAAELVLLQDVSDRNLALRALEQERDRARQYLQVAEAILVALDEDARVTMLNRKGYQLLGYAAGELEGRDWFQTCLPPGEQAHALAQHRRRLAGLVAPTEPQDDSVITRSGERRQIAWRHALVHDESGRIAGSLSSGEDITERRRAEEALRALNTGLEARVRERTRQLADSNFALVEARDAADAAHRVKGEFLANMSHEIRTPMNAIIGMTELARRVPGLPPKADGYLSNIGSAADTLLDIINQILDFSKIESGRLELARVEFGLAELIERLLSLVGFQAAEKGLDLQVEVAPDVPGRLVGDPLRIGQVLLNLCGNAVKFTHRGAIRLAISQDGSPGDAGVWLRFAVRDTGIGIDAAGQARLFQAFNQVDPSTARHYGGTGLGLAISRQLVEAMGGSIGVSSEPGVGSEFHFRLPLGCPGAACGADERLVVPLQHRPDPVPAGAAADVAATAAPPLQGCRILLVEDNELNRIVATDLLEGVGGASVSAAHHGAQALARLAGEVFDIVLMDLQMPGMDGFETTTRLRANPALADLPVIAMTAHAMARDRERCLAIGMNDFVAKPFDPHDLFAVLARAWQRGRPAQAQAVGAETDPAPAVNLAAGLDRCLGRRDLFARVVQQFLDSHADDATRLQAAQDGGQIDGIAALAHTVVATAGTIGADGLSQLARELQTAARARDLPRLPDLLQRFTLQHGRVLTELRAHLAAAG